MTNPINSGIAGFGSTNMSPVNNPSITDMLTNNNGAAPVNIGDLGTDLGNNANGGGFNNFLSNFKNGDGSLNFGNIGQGVGMLGDIFSTFMALKQFGMAEDAFKLDQNVTKDNHNNNVALAQQQINDRDFQRQANQAASNATAAQFGLPAPANAAAPNGPTLQNSLATSKKNAGGRAQQSHP